MKKIKFQSSKGGVMSSSTPTRKYSAGAGPRPGFHRQVKIIIMMMMVVVIMMIMTVRVGMMIIDDFPRAPPPLLDMERGWRWHAGLVITDH